MECGICGVCGTEERARRTEERGKLSHVLRSGVVESQWGHRGAPHSLTPLVFGINFPSIQPRQIFQPNTSLPCEFCSNLIRPRVPSLPDELVCGVHELRVEL